MRPKSNELANTHGCDNPPAPKGNSPNNVLFGANTSNTALITLDVGEALRIKTFDLPDPYDIKIFEVDKSTGSACADTGSGDTFPYDPCCSGKGKTITKRGVTYVSGEGSYRFEFNGETGTANVKYSIVKSADVSHAMLCQPCVDPVPPCVDTTWEWTGKERVDDTRFQREEVSNCGKTRWVDNRAVVWTATGDFDCRDNILYEKQTSDAGGVRWAPNMGVDGRGVQCGHSPSEAITNGCDCSEVLYGYLPGERVPHDANVPVYNCNNDIIYFASSTFGSGKYPVKDCNGRTVMYLWTRSTTAPERFCS